MYKKYVYIKHTEFEVLGLSQLFLEITFLKVVGKRIVETEEFDDDIYILLAFLF